MTAAARTTVTSEASTLEVSAGDFPRLTHYLFRYPAKFHPPVAKALLERYTVANDTVLDPFCGSGTLLVEATAMRRSAIGIDVDPVAVALTRAKLICCDPAALEASARRVTRNLATLALTDREYDQLAFTDIAPDAYDRASLELSSFIPAIPNLFHWFRRYVILDLARIRREISRARLPHKHRDFLLIVFASIIRNSSNADPVPVSGLEVTSHMKRLDREGRRINPYALFTKALRRALAANRDFFAHSTDSNSTLVLQGNAVELGSLKLPTVDAVITSPPYHGAVDYYRRHQLEMYWLDLTRSPAERLALLDKYIGRPHVPKRDPLLATSAIRTGLAQEWEQRIRASSEERARAFRHYICAMDRTFLGMAKLLPPGRPAVIVVGHSRWNSSEIPTADLFQEISGGLFELREICSYPLKNRYMSYKRHNGADILTEYVLAFRRTETPAPTC